MHASTSITTVPRVSTVVMRHLHRATSVHAGETSRGATSKPARMAATFRATCCVRYDGSDAVTAASSESSATMPVAATYAPSMIIEAVMMLPRSTARSVAAHLDHLVLGRRSKEPSNTVVFTSTRLPDRSFARVGSEKSWCMKIADQVSATVGGAPMAPSASTRVASVLPPRIIPP